MASKFTLSIVSLILAAAESPVRGWLARASAGSGTVVGRLTSGRPQLTLFKTNTGIMNKAPWGGTRACGAVDHEFLNPGSRSRCFCPRYIWNS